MHRSHSRHTHLAGKLCPKEFLKSIHLENRTNNSIARTSVKRFHTRKSRQWLKRELDDMLDEYNFEEEI